MIEHKTPERKQAWDHARELADAYKLAQALLVKERKEGYRDRVHDARQDFLNAVLIYAREVATGTQFQAVAGVRLMLEQLSGCEGRELENLTQEYLVLAYNALLKPGTEPRGSIPRVIQTDIVAGLRDITEKRPS